MSLTGNLAAQGLWLSRLQLPRPFPAFIGVPASMITFQVVQSPVQPGRSATSPIHALWCPTRGGSSGLVGGAAGIDRHGLGLCWGARDRAVGGSRGVECATRPPAFSIWQPTSETPASPPGSTWPGPKRAWRAQQVQLAQAKTDLDTATLNLLRVIGSPLVRVVARRCMRFEPQPSAGARRSHRPGAGRPAGVVGSSRTVAHRRAERGAAVGAWAPSVSAFRRLRQQRMKPTK